MTSSTYLETALNGQAVVIEAIRLPGSENTSVGDFVADRLTDFMASASGAVIAIAAEASAMVDKVRAQATQASSIEVEFSVSVTAEGKVLIGSLQTAGTFGIKLTYANDA